ncbi:MAG: MBL fold metallo-hydrolase [Oscillospiraceae bacterium]|jgi:L-ascorbate metabolism protein UlaG (beta-lactamase superfamily)|nr:MBL fold metallo-hydrolase [Oscillospiraceae bacterium]
MSATITWLGQAGYIIKDGDYSLVIDPYFTDSIAGSGFVRLYPPPFGKGELKVDSVIATHNHGDHLDIGTLRDYVEFATFYGPDSCVAALKDAGFEAGKLKALNRGDTAQAGPFALKAVFADHTPDSIGVIVTCADLKLYFTGDSLMNDELLSVADLKPDILFTCINGKFGNMNWQSAVDLARALKVKTAIPMHYDMFAINSEDPAVFVNALGDGPVHPLELQRNRVYEVASLIK